jgi:hypothetical protein
MPLQAVRHSNELLSIIGNFNKITLCNKVLSKEETKDVSQNNMLVDYVQKIDNNLIRIPMKLQEEMEQLMETRMIVINLIRTYELEIKIRDGMLKDANQYVVLLEKALDNAKIALPEKPKGEPIVQPIPIPKPQ